MLANSCWTSGRKKNKHDSFVVHGRVRTEKQANKVIAVVATIQGGEKKELVKNHGKIQVPKRRHMRLSFIHPSQTSRPSETQIRPPLRWKCRCYPCLKWSPSDVGTLGKPQFVISREMGATSLCSTTKRKWHTYA